MATNETIHLDSEMIKALAHPLRMRLLALLRIDGPSTATALASRTGNNSGATSYHLRQLADVGLVEEDPDLGSKRERFWRASQQAMSWRATEHDTDPDARAASEWLVRYLHRRYGQMVDEWLDVRDDWPTAWRDAADQSDCAVTVTPEQLTELTRRVQAVYAEYDTDEPDERAERVFLINYAVPQRAVTL